MVRQQKNCPVCGGSGKIICDKCNGTGLKGGYQVSHSVSRAGRMSSSTCYGCKGQGKQTCYNCGGTGKQ